MQNLKKEFVLSSLTLLVLFAVAIVTTVTTEAQVKTTPVTVPSVKIELSSPTGIKGSLASDFKGTLGYINLSTDNSAATYGYKVLIDCPSNLEVVASNVDCNNGVYLHTGSTLLVPLRVVNNNSSAVPLKVTVQAIKYDGSLYATSNTVISVPPTNTKSNPQLGLSISDFATTTYDGIHPNVTFTLNLNSTTPHEQWNIWNFCDINTFPDVIKSSAIHNSGTANDHIYSRSCYAGPDIGGQDYEFGTSTSKVKYNLITSNLSQNFTVKAVILNSSGVIITQSGFGVVKINLATGIVGTVAETPSITVSNPNSGDALKPGSRIPITWKTKGLASSQRLDVVLNIVTSTGGHIGKNIATNIPNSGTYNWMVQPLQPIYASEIGQTIYPTGNYSIDVVCPVTDNKCNFSPNFGDSGVFTISSSTPINPPTPCYNFTLNLTVGSTGADVVALQKFLQSKGFWPVGNNSNDPSGYFGSLTKSALMAYQTSVGIPATGFAGPLTLAKLNASCTNTNSVVISETNAFKGPLGVNVSNTEQRQQVTFNFTLTAGNSPVFISTAVTDSATLAPNSSIVFAAKNNIVPTKINFTSTSANAGDTSDHFYIAPGTSRKFTFVGLLSNTSLGAVNGVNVVQIAGINYGTTGATNLSANSISTGLENLRIVSDITIGNVIPSQPSVTIIGTPSLVLNYDSAQKESSLLATFNLNVRAGSSDLYLYTGFVGSNLIDQNGGSVSAVVNVGVAAGEKSNTYGNYTVLPSGSSVQMTVTMKANPKQMFAGSYHGFLSNIFTFTANSIEPVKLMLPSNTTNDVTIIGETSPYVNSIYTTSLNSLGYLIPGGNVTVTGVRFANVMSSTFATSILIDGENKGIGFSVPYTGLTINFDLPQLTNGYHTFQFVNDRGASNIVSFQVQSTSTPPVTGAKIVASVDPASPASDIIKISTTDVTSNIPLAVFDLNTQGGSATLNTLRLDVNALSSKWGGNPQPNKLFSNIQIKASGITYSETSVSNQEVNFTNLMIPLPVNTTVPIVVYGSVPQNINNYYDGATVLVGLPANTYSVSAVDSNYNQVPVSGSKNIGSDLIYANTLTFTSATSTIGQPQVTGLGTNSAQPGEKVAMYIKNFPISTTLTYNVSFTSTVVPNSTTVVGQLSSDGSYIGFTVPSLSVGTYNVSAFTSSGVNSYNYLPFTIESIPTPLPPVISGGTFPTQLNAGQQGTWTVNASDPQNGSLSYSVDWGDLATNCSSTAPCVLSRMTPVQSQSSTFTHVYSRSGTFKVTFTVTNAAGLNAQTTSTVNIYNGTVVVPTLAVSLDASSPAVSYLPVPQSNVTLAVIDLGAGQNPVTGMNGIQVGSDSKYAPSLSNITIYDGSTVLGTASSLVNNGSYYYQWINISGVSIPANVIKPLRITADISGSVSTSSSIRLGITGLNFDSPGASVTGTPVYGAGMYFIPSNISVVTPLPPTPTPVTIPTHGTTSIPVVTTPTVVTTSTPVITSTSTTPTVVTPPTPAPTTNVITIQANTTYFCALRTPAMVMRNTYLDPKMPPPAKPLCYASPSDPTSPNAFFGQAFEKYTCPTGYTLASSQPTNHTCTKNTTSSSSSIGSLTAAVWNSIVGFFTGK